MRASYTLPRPEPLPGVARQGRDDVLPAFCGNACSRESHKLGGAGHCGGRDDGCAVGTRDDGGCAGGGLRAGAAGGCAEGSGNFKINSATADSTLAISRDVSS